MQTYKAYVYHKYIVLPRHKPRHICEIPL